MEKVGFQEVLIHLQDSDEVMGLERLAVFLFRGVQHDGGGGKLWGLI